MYLNPKHTHSDITSEGTICLPKLSCMADQKEALIMAGKSACTRKILPGWCGAVSEQKVMQSLHHMRNQASELEALVSPPRHKPL